MHPSVADYLDALTHELRFDGELARRVRREVEEHLCDAVAGESVGDDTEAARRVIARFGQPRDIARGYVPSSLLRQVRQVGAVLVVAIAAIFILMKGRAALYEVLQWQLHADWLGIAAAGKTIDIHAFRAALIAGVLGWLYIASRRPPASPPANYRLQVNRCLFLPLAASIMLLGAVSLDTLLAVLRLHDAELSLALLIPLGSIAVEMALVTTIATLLCRTIYRTALATALLADTR
jgi:hypothetical protein